MTARTLYKMLLFETVSKIKFANIRGYDISIDIIIICAVSIRKNNCPHAYY